MRNMLVIIFLLTVFSCANGDESDQPDSLDPSCDLVSVSHVDINTNENGTLDIDFSWDRKEESYESIGGPIRMYVVRHGPIANGKLVNNSEIIEIPFPENDAFTLTNVQPYYSYGVQVCAVTRSYKFLFEKNVWDRAWVGSMSLGEYRSSNQEPSSDDELPASNSDKNSFRPECDLVETSYVDIDEDTGATSLIVHFSWDKKPTSYENSGPIEGYTIRHGPQSQWEANIEEDVARYLRVGSENESFVLDKVPRGGYYGLQICAVTNTTVGQYIDWKKEAWLGGMDFTSFDADNRNAPSLPEGDMADVFGGLEAPIENATFKAQCDLVQTSHVAADEDQDSITMHFWWEKKSDSYASFGPITGYRVRYGRQAAWGSGIDESDARYLYISNDTTSFDLLDIPRGIYYGIQICALAGVDDDVEWQKDAWLGSMDFTSYAPAGDTDSNEKTVDQNNVVLEKEHRVYPIMRNGLGTDYTILLAVLAAITIVFIVLACAWVGMWRKRQQSKPNVEPAIKQGTTVP